MKRHGGTARCTRLAASGRRARLARCFDCWGTLNSVGRVDGPRRCMRRPSLYLLASISTAMTDLLRTWAIQYLALSESNTLLEDRTRSMLVSPMQYSVLAIRGVGSAYEPQDMEAGYGFRLPIEYLEHRHRAPPAYSFQNARPPGCCASSSACPSRSRPFPGASAFPIRHARLSLRFAPSFLASVAFLPSPRLSSTPSPVPSRPLPVPHFSAVALAHLPPVHARTRPQRQVDCSRRHLQCSPSPHALAAVPASPPLAPLSMRSTPG